MQDKTQTTAHMTGFHGRDDEVRRLKERVFPELPEGWRVISLTSYCDSDGTIYRCSIQSAIKPDQSHVNTHYIKHYAEGTTPRAAVEAAIAKIKESE